VLSLVLVLATACGGTPSATLVTPSAQASAPAGIPSRGPTVTAPGALPSAGSSSVSVKIVRPTEGATVPASSFVIDVEASGITLINKIGSPPAPGEGHFIYYVGVDFVPTQAGKPAHTAPGSYTASFQPSYTWSNPPAGKQAIAVQLVNNDDTPLSPPVTARATVTVQ
jgi:hypothetical protein